MTIQEMHIAVNLGVQKIASFQVDNLLPQEIDHELNNAMDRFIKQRYSPLGNKYRDGFEQSQKRIDDLRNLVVDAKLKAFNTGETLTGYFVDRAALPVDYMFLVNVIADTYYKCGGVLVEDLDYTRENMTFKYLTADLEYSPGWILTDFQYSGTTIVHNESGITKEDIVSSIGSGTSNSNIIAIDSMPGVIDGSNSYLEEFYLNTDNANSNFIEGSVFGASFWMTQELTPTINSNQILFMGSNGAQAIKFIWTNAAGNEHTVTYSGWSIKNLYYKVPKALTRQKVVASYVQHDDLYSMLYDPFNTTGIDRTKYTIQENFIDIHNDNKFFTTFVDIKYIRRPKRMNNGSNVGCELPEHTHQEIVEMAIQSILEAISDPRYNSQSREVLESE